MCVTRHDSGAIDVGLGARVGVQRSHDTIVNPNTMCNSLYCGGIAMGDTGQNIPITLASSVQSDEANCFDAAYYSDTRNQQWNAQY